MGILMRNQVWKICAIALFLLSPLQASACSCHDSHFTTLPVPGGDLAVDGRILLDGHGDWSKQLGALSERGVMLMSGREKIPLRVERVLDEAGRRGAAVLAPVGKLKSGQRYSLVAQPPGEKKIVPLSFEGKPIEWRAVTASPKAAVPLRFEPVLTWIEASAGDLAEGGCGPSVSMTLRVPSELGEVVLVSTAGAQASAYYPMKVANQLLELSWGPCGGVFRLEPGQRYTLEVRGAAQDFSPLDTVKGVFEFQVPPVGKTPRPAP